MHGSRYASHASARCPAAPRSVVSCARFLYLTGTVAISLFILDDISILAVVMMIGLSLYLTGAPTQSENYTRW